MCPCACEHVRESVLDTPHWARLFVCLGDASWWNKWLECFQSTSPACAQSASSLGPRVCACACVCARARESESLTFIERYYRRRRNDWVTVVNHTHQSPLKVKGDKKSIPALKKCNANQSNDEVHYQQEYSANNQCLTNLPWLASLWSLLQRGREKTFIFSFYSSKAVKNCCVTDVQSSQQLFMSKSLTT